MTRSMVLPFSALAMVAAMAAAPIAKADAVADFYSGKQLSIRVGFGAGGGYDTTTRIVARHLGRHIPGNPTVVVQNMPGGGSLRVANYLYNAAPKNGLLLAVFSSAMTMQPLFGNKQAKFVPNKFEWIGSMHTDIQACGVWNGAGQGIRTLPDLIKAKKTVIFGSTGPASPTSMFPLFLRHAFGAKIKVIQGYKGTKGINLAMQRGEVQGTCGMYVSSVKGAFLRFVESGELKLFMQVGIDRKAPFFGDASHLYSMLKTDEHRKIAEIIFRPAELTRPIAAPPGTPRARVTALRKALLDTMKDPALKKDGKKIKVDFVPMSGDQVAKLVRGFYTSPPDLVKKAYEFTTE